jgi:NADPH:quinone reductase-like Zn-dependent oxidoreductase
MPTALVCTRLGDPATPIGTAEAPLKLREVASQVPLDPYSVRVKVAAASLNYADALVVQGCAQMLSVSDSRDSPTPFIVWTTGCTKRSRPFPSRLVAR